MIINDNSKVVKSILNEMEDGCLLRMVWYEEPPQQDYWGSNDIVYTIYWHEGNNTINISKIGGFGDSYLLKTMRINNGIMERQDFRNFADFVKEMTWLQFVTTFKIR